MAEDDHGQAVLVDVLGAGGLITSSNDYPHVTVSCEGGPLYGGRYDLIDEHDASNIYILF